MNAGNYKLVEEQFEDWIYRNERVELFHSPLYDMYSQLGESEGDFRSRLDLKGREVWDAAVAGLRKSFESKLRSKTGQLQRTELAVEREKAQADSASLQAGTSILGGLLGSLLGRKSRRSSVSSATRALKQRKDVEIAREKVRIIADDLAALESDLAAEVAELRERFEAHTTELEPEVVKPYKKDIEIKSVSLLWLPYNRDGQPVW